MISFDRLSLDAVPWEELDQYPDRTIFQTRPWLRFLERTQRGEPVVARIHQGGSLLGYFTGVVVRRFGVRILGAPLKGWTTAYMGFNLPPGMPRGEVLSRLPEFSFRQLGCDYLELMDRASCDDDRRVPSYEIGVGRTFEIDLTRSEDDLLRSMDETCRRYARRPERTGLVIEEANDAQFAENYYEQLRDVFAKRRLVPTYKIDRVRELIANLTPARNLLLLRARDADGTCVATGLFPAFNDTAYFWGGASWRKHQRLRPNEPLMWEAMRYWRERGITKFDFGGAGQYKEKFGPRTVILTRFMRSRLPFLVTARHAAREAWRIRQRVIGRLTGRP